MRLLLLAVFGLLIGVAVGVGTHNLMLGLAAWLFCGYLELLAGPSVRQSQARGAGVPTPGPRTPRVRRTEVE